MKWEIASFHLRQGATNVRDFFHLSSERSSPLSYGGRTSHSPNSQPLVSLLTSQPFFGDLHRTAPTDLNKHILGVCDPPKGKVNVASIAMSITSLYFATFVPLSENH